MEVDHPGTERAARRDPRSEFTLPGRPDLERFFNEHIVDIVRHRERYKALGIGFPAAVVLHGPPGCGKTFAVERLVDFLGWPCFHVEASTVASPYIHETSRKVADVFETAAKNAPSVLVIDEMDAFLSDRQMGTGHHRVEEVAEFLRRIPEATKNEVLVIAMTNRIELIDPAILRRGRFDHVVKVDPATFEEILALLRKLLGDLPTEGDVELGQFAAALTGRPLSDVAFIVREASRLAARICGHPGHGVGGRWIHRRSEPAAAAEGYDPAGLGATAASPEPGSHAEAIRRCVRGVAFGGHRPSRGARVVCNSR
jgi:hypothetical protein